MQRIVNIIFIVFGLFLSTGLVYGEEPCTLQTFSGTYVFTEKGSSAIFDPVSEPYPMHWQGAFAPFVTIGRVTMGPDGSGSGHFWIRVGSVNGGLDPISVEVTVVEMNEDCSGKFTAEFEFAGMQETILERFVLFDSGREFRAIPIEGGAPTLAWVMEAHRISKPGELLGNCGPHTAKGQYIWTADALLRFDLPYPLFSDTMLMRLDIAESGEYTGILYEKMGPNGGIELPISGTVTVAPDCTFTQSLEVVVGGIPFTDPLRGVFYDGGKRGFALSVNTDPIGLQSSFAEFVRVGR